MSDIDFEYVSEVKELARKSDYSEDRVFILLDKRRVVPEKVLVLVSFRKDIEYGEGSISSD